jgi:hypothetical protein
MDGGEYSDYDQQVSEAVKNPGPKNLALVCPLEGGSPGLCSAQHTYGVLASGSQSLRLGESNGVLEKQNPTPIFGNFKQGSLGFSDA